MVDYRVCTKCGEKQNIGMFQKQRSGKGGFRSWCKLCVRTWFRNRLKTDSGKERHNYWAKVGNWRLHILVFAHYCGGEDKIRCQCPCGCKENNPKMLTIGHIGGGGTKHRQSLSNKNFYRWLKLNNFPSGIRIECFNCNCGAYRNGGDCPNKHINFEVKV